jgi:hypothetical protein
MTPSNLQGEFVSYHESSSEKRVSLYGSKASVTGFSVSLKAKV